MRYFFRLALRSLFLVSSCLVFLSDAPAAYATIRYEVSLAHPEQHCFHVKMDIPDVSGEALVQMPAWNALYQIRDFSSHVRQVEAFAGSERAPIEKLDKQTWRITGKGTVTLRYATCWDEPGPFSTQLNAEHAFINLAMILFYVPDRRAEAVFLGLGDIPGMWTAAGPTMHVYSRFSAVQSVIFTAPNYDALVDAPIEAGRFQQFELPGVSPPIRVVVHGDNWKKKQMEDTLQRICQYELKLMDGAPFEHYTFILHIGKGAAGAGGGMEHANSTAIYVPSDENLAGVAAHEFFHLWNVKRIRPASLEPVDYTREQYTRALWFAEGVTNAYASYTMARTGLWTKQQFYADLSDQITEHESRPASRWQSAEESSLDAWLEKYPVYNRSDYSVSYYTKGQILGVLLDVLVRDRTNNAASLDDVLRSMNQDFARKGRTYRDSVDVRLTAESVAGASFEDFFRRYVAGAEPLPYNQVLPLAGLELRSTTRKRSALGFSLERTPAGEWRITGLDSESPAAQAGLRDGDAILRWNDGEVPRRIQRWLREQKPGEKVRVRLLREGKEETLEFRLGEVTETFWQVVEAASAGEKARRVREGLLHGITETPAGH